MANPALSRWDGGPFRGSVEDVEVGLRVLRTGKKDRQDGPLYTHKIGLTRDEIFSINLICEVFFDIYE